ncbi:MAG TPA: Tm-1-like ATP-binding domain-containing protein, partial [Pirellulales bacterium]|nr:Tm-1-like ATP-binding domain-containing protein [Pirellulales bacterium]
DSVPAQFSGRTFYRHNANVTLMRTTPGENAAIGTDIGGKLAAAAGPVVVFLPQRGVSALDRDGQPFNDPQARQALFDAIRRSAESVEIVDVDRHINDPEFAAAAAKKLLEMLASLGLENARVSYN